MSMAILLSTSFAGFFDGDAGELKIKGFYIGMPIEEALVCAKNSVQGTSVANWSEHMKIETHDDSTSSIIIRNGFGMPLMIVIGDNNGKVTMFGMEWVAVNAVFNAGDMSLKEFAQLFIDSYGIPQLQPDEAGNNLEHTYLSGVKVTVTGDKGFLVQKTSSQSERKAAFN
jgi:hypothetical protein